MKRLFRRTSKRERREEQPVIEYDDDAEAAAPTNSTSTGAPTAPTAANDAPSGAATPQPNARRPAPRSRTYKGPPNASVHDIVGWLCGVGRDDWSTVLSLAEDCSTSQDMAKEAVRALRKELEHGASEPQSRAARLIVIMSRNGGDRFRLQLAQKKFLDAIEKVLKSPKTSPEVYNMLFKALSVLSYENQRDRDLAPIVALWNRLKRPEDPVNGNAIDADDPVFSPQEIPQRRRIHSPQPPRTDLFTEAQVARSNAAMLSEALSFTRPEELDSNELVQEFYAKCQESQATLVDAIPFATNQADQARAQRPPIESLPEGQAPPPPSQEEEMLASLLSANQDLIDVFRMHDDISRQRRQANDEREAQQRSLVETRYDRNAALQVPQQDPFAGASGSSENLHSSSSHGRMDYANADLEDDRTRTASNDDEQAYGGYISSPQKPLRSLSPTSGYSTSPPLAAAIRSPPALPSTNPYAAQAAPAQQPLNPFTRAALPAGAGLSASSPPNNGRTASPEPYNLVEEPTADDLSHFPASNPYRSPPRSASNTSFPAATNPYGTPSRAMKTSTSSNSTNPYLSRLGQNSGGGGGERTPTREGSLAGTDEEPSTPVEPSAKALGKLRRFSMRDDEATGDAEAERQQAALEQALREKYAQNAASKRSSGVP